jgi:hypothetical protein
MKNVVLSGEYVTILSNEFERQFKGRVFLLPPYTYIKDSLEEEIIRFSAWKEDLHEKGFKYVFFLNGDDALDKSDHGLGSSLLKVHPVPLEHVESKIKQQIITDEVQALVPFIIKAWRN